MLTSIAMTTSRETLFKVILLQLLNPKDSLRRDTLLLAAAPDNTPLPSTSLSCVGSYAPGGTSKPMTLYSGVMALLSKRFEWKTPR